MRFSLRMPRRRRTVLRQATAILPCRCRRIILGQRLRRNFTMFKWRPIPCRRTTAAQWHRINWA
jgi:hypothetical protein